MRIARSCICCSGTSLSSSQAILMPFVAHRVFNWKPVEVTKEWGMRDVPVGKHHTPCNSLQCLDCGVSFLDMRFDEEECRRLYDGYRDENYTLLRNYYETDYLERNKRLVKRSEYVDKVEKFLRPFLTFPVRILDWGGDTGLNAPFVEDRSALHIFDISNKEPINGVKRVEPLSITVYDLVNCSHVLEHVPYPLNMMDQIKPQMHSNSILYVEVPNEYPEGNNKPKRFWHEHVNRFSEKSLFYMASQCRMGVLGFQTLKPNSPSAPEVVYQMALKKHP